MIHLNDMHLQIQYIWLDMIFSNVLFRTSLSLKNKYMLPWPFSTNDLENKLRGDLKQF